MTIVFRSAMTVVIGVVIFITGWYVGSNNIILPGANLAESKKTYSRDEYSLRYPNDWQVAEIAAPTGEQANTPVPVNHVSFNRETTQGDSKINDCTFEVRTYNTTATPSLEAWAKTVLGVENPAFGEAVKFVETKVGGKQGLKTEAGKDLFVESGGQVFYLTVGDSKAQVLSKSAGDSCTDSAADILRSFKLK